MQDHRHDSLNGCEDVTELAEGALLTATLFVGFILHGLCIRLGALRGFAMPIERKWFGENRAYRGVICVALGTAWGSS